MPVTKISRVELTDEVTALTRRNTPEEYCDGTSSPHNGSNPSISVFGVKR